MKPECKDSIPQALFNKLDKAAARRAKARGPFALPNNDDYIAVVQANVSQVQKAIDALMASPAESTAPKLTPRIKTEPPAQPAVESVQEAIKTDKELAAEAWDTVAFGIDDAPMFESLSEDTQNTFIEFQQRGHWGHADVVREMQAMSNPRYSKTQAKPTLADDLKDQEDYLQRAAEVAGYKDIDAFAENDYDGFAAVAAKWRETHPADALYSLRNGKTAPQSVAAQVLSDIKKLLRLDALNSKIAVVQSVGDLPPGVRQSVNVDAKTQGFVYQGKAYLVADNIAPGKARSVFLHEVGAHLGLENLLGKDQYKALVNQIKKWAERNDGSQESKLAKVAQQRVTDAETSASQSDTELVAYFIEEAVDAGVDPTATKANSELGRWLQQVWAALKRAVMKLGLNPDNMTARDVVDMAYGAAHIEASSGAASKVGEVLGRGTQFSKIVDSLKAYIQRANKTLFRVNPQSKLDEHMQLAAAAIESSFSTIEREVVNAKRAAPQGLKGELLQKFVRSYITNNVGGVPIGPTPHTLEMLGAPMQMMRMDAGVIYKVFLEKHGAEMESVTPERLVQAIYQPTLVLKTKTGSQFDLVLDILGADGPLLVAVENNVPLGAKGEGAVSTVKTVFGKAVTGVPDSIGDRIKRGDVVFADTGMSLETPKTANATHDGQEAYGALMDAAIGGKAPGAVPNRVSKLQKVLGNASHALMPKIKAGILEKKPNGSRVIATDDARTAWIGDNYKGAVKDAPAFSKAAPIRSGVAVVDSMPGAVSSAWEGLKFAGTKAAATLMLTDSLLSQATRVISSAAAYKSAMDRINVAKTRQEQKVADILAAFKSLTAHEQAGPNSVNALVRDSTMTKKWAFEPEWLKPNERTEVDPVLQGRFNALSPEAQDVAVSVFKHGYDSLQAMKKAVTESVASEFDPEIYQAEKAGDTTKVAQLTKKKQKSMDDFSTLIGQRGAWPYAPLRRFGNHVVIGMSAKYLAASDAGDIKAMREMEDDGDHYFVSFAETRAAAQSDLAKIKDRFPDGYVDTFERLEQADSMMGGRDMLGALKRLRGLAEQDADEATSARVKDLMRKLYLTLLAENSARKGEINRRNIAGADEDMMRAFASNGRTTAHFIASLETGGAVTDALTEMRAQVRARTPGREMRQMYFNEIMRRHSMNLELRSSPLTDKALGLTSGYLLLSNPSYFLINATQPWMMSLPWMAGRHGYTATAAALLNSYKGMPKVLRDGKLDGSDYALLPEDVRSAVKALADRGVISIELSHDMGGFHSLPEGRVMGTVASVTNKVRSAAQSVETLNRLTTAITAYRLEFARTGSAEGAVEYAAEVIGTTHGNYSGFNAPRFMRTDLGRLATQFRKFQLIQLTMFAKILSMTFAKGDSAAAKEERAVGRRVLMMNLAQLGAMGGMVALPGFALVSMVLGKAFGDDDEPDDLRAKITREYGKPMADLLWGGASQKIGVPIGPRIGAGGMLSLLPYTDMELSRKGYQGAFTAAAGPLFGGLAPKVVDGIGMIASGDLWKGSESLLPTGFANASKSIRFKIDGMTKRNGDVTLSPDEIGYMDVLLQTVGLPPATVADRTWLNGAKFEADKFYKDRTTELKRQFIEAYESNDPDARREAIDTWNATQAARRQLGYKVQPLSDLLRSPQEARKRVKNNAEGFEDALQ